MNCSTPGLPVHHQLPEFTQTQRPSSRWCHPAISSSVFPFSCLQSLPASESFPMSQLFPWSGQSNWSFSFSIIPSKEIPGLISFQSERLSRVFSNTTVEVALVMASSGLFTNEKRLSKVKEFVWDHTASWWPSWDQNSEFPTFSLHSHVLRLLIKSR